MLSAEDVRQHVAAAFARTHARALKVAEAAERVAELLKAGSEALRAVNGDGRILKVRSVETKMHADGAATVVILVDFAERWRGDRVNGQTPRPEWLRYSVKLVSSYKDAEVTMASSTAPEVENPVAGGDDPVLRVLDSMAIGLAAKRAAAELAPPPPPAAPEPAPPPAPAAPTAGWGRTLGAAAQQHRPETGAA
jgi:hypothetical protein